eukprot:evm.model.scf_877.6 EVM.evm.TU.scf_877.6   scf_877:52103-52587(-)
MAEGVEEIAKNKAFGGWNRRYKHSSSACGCDMIFQIFFPPASDSAKVPVSVHYFRGPCRDVDTQARPSNASRTG